MKRKRKSNDITFSIRQRFWKCRNFIRNRPLIAALIFVFSLLIFYRAFFGNTTAAIIPPRKQVMDAMPEKVIMKEETIPYDPNGIKAERLWNEIQAEEVKKTAGKKPTVGPFELNAASWCIHALGGQNKPEDGTKLIMFKQCLGEDRLKWEIQSDGEWSHVLSGKCIEVRKKELVFANSPCSAQFTFEHGKILHEASGKCVGSRPRKDAKVELMEACEHSHWGIASSVSNRRKDLPKPNFVKERVKKVAISTLIMKDPVNPESSGFLDSAGVLVMSIRAAKLTYDYDLIAIVSKKVQTARPVLKKLGFKILEFDLPMQPEEIRNEQVRKEMLEDGCCGMDELLKLHAWRLFEYDRVLQIDADILFHRNFDELFEYDTTLSWTHGALDGSEPLNGGFLVIRPNQDDYDEMVEIIKEGDFRGGSGWRGVCCWVYGGRTIQGIVPYFYIHHKKVRHQEVERCQYNNMVETDRCKTWNYDHVTSNHFTVCLKPFQCSDYNARRFPLCGNFTRKWWEFSEKLEDAVGVSHRPRCQRGKYTAIDWGKASALPPV